MTFIPTTAQTAKTKVLSSGEKDSKIAIIGEAPSVEEIKQGKPFVGPAGSVLERCLHAAGLTRSELYITNTIKEKIGSDKTKWYRERRRAGVLRPEFSEAGQAYVEELREELQEVSANILVPMGAMAHAALCDRASITRYRGYVFDSTLLPGRKVLPTLHPATVIHGQYVWQYYIQHDLLKAKQESHTPAFLYPPAEIQITDSADEAVAWLNQIRYESPVSIDIEVTNLEVSYISFSALPNKAFSICLYHADMTDQEEMVVWRKIADILEDPDIIKIFQNGIFDIQFILEHNHILTRGPIQDTMIAHSLMYPDFLKGLEFIGSIYTHHPYWKDKVSFTKANIEKRDG